MGRVLGRDWIQAAEEQIGGGRLGLRCNALGVWDGQGRGRGRALQA